MASSPNPAFKLAHVRPVRPLRFPAEEPWEEHLGQHPRHEDLCMLLKLLLRALCGEAHAVSADMFLYWNAADERHCRAPDAAVKVGLPLAVMLEHGSWKTWELGVPELVVEVLSESDTPEKWTLAEKLAAYTELGVREFVCFDLDAAEGARLRIWDRIDGDFVERIVDGDRSPCALLTQLLGAKIDWTITPWGRYPAALRLLRDGGLVPSEGESLASERVRAEGERTRAEGERARADAAEARIAELEALVRKS